MRPTPGDDRLLDESVIVLRGHVIGYGVPSTSTAGFWISRSIKARKYTES